MHKCYGFNFLCHVIKKECVCVCSACSGDFVWLCFSVVCCLTTSDTHTHRGTADTNTPDLTACQQQLLLSNKQLISNSVTFIYLLCRLKVNGFKICTVQKKAASSMWAGPEPCRVKFRRLRHGVCFHWRHIPECVCFFKKFRPTCLWGFSFSKY